MAEFTPGTVVDGRYKILNRVGSGGMADVFCAEDQQLGRQVALKLLHRRFAEDPDFVERFRREAQAAAGLQHPNVVSVYDRGEFGGTYYIAMEYLPGRTLKGLIRAEAPLDPVRAIDLTLQILKAARFAHRRGVIHRDLKPHNVMVDDSDHAKVTDFGIARAGASDMTETGSIMGTAQYLSPEQAQGLPVTASSDLYSVAVVLYELLTARVPFDAEAAVTIALKHVSEAPIPPSRLNPAVPAPLEQVVLWALNKDAADRPADADQLIDALNQARAAILAAGTGQRTADMPALAIAGGVDEAERTRVHNGPAAVAPGAAAAAYGAAALGGAAGAARGDRYTGSYDAPPPPDAGGRPRRSRWPWYTLALLVLVGGAVAAFLVLRPQQAVVPPVANLTVAVAQAEVQSAGFNTALVYRTDAAKKDLVISQFPLGGTKRDTGSTVTLTVSTGPGNVIVPPVQDSSQNDAKRAIRAAGLTVSHVVMQPSDSVQQGSAIGTDPPSGQSLPAGTGVNLFVSSGPPPVVVPNVVGATKSDAESHLAGLNISLHETTQPSSTDPPDTVISQNVTGKVPAGTNVVLTIAITPPTVAVPDVTGQDAAVATSTLKQAGFKVSETKKTVSDPTQDGVVLSQSPDSSASAPQNSTVKLVVGHFKATPTTTTTTTTTPPATSPAPPTTP